MADPIILTPPAVKVAVTQAEPIWLDLEKTVQKTCDLIYEAASNGAKLISFPECWIPGYPAWIWSRPVDFALSTTYIKNSLCIPSPQLSAIQAAAAANSIAVVLGFSEHYQGSLYIAQAIISSDGCLLTHRRKIKPTHMERTIFGDAAGGNETLANTVLITLKGRRATDEFASGDSDGDGDVEVHVSSLACWEHAQPLLKYYTALQRPFLHIAAWPPVYPHGGAPVDPTLWSMSAEGCRSLSQTFAIESQAFVLHTTAVITDKGIKRMGIDGGPLMGRPGGGSSAIYGPDGMRLTEDLDPATEGILYATLDSNEVLKAKGFLDLGGHYSRPDILWLGLDKKVKKHFVVEE